MNCHRFSTGLSLGERGNAGWGCYRARRGWPTNVKNRARWLLAGAGAMLCLMLYSHQISADTDTERVSACSNAVCGRLVELGKAARRGPRIGRGNMPLPAMRAPRWLFAVPGYEVQGRFIRVWPVSGPVLCQRLHEKGIGFSQWQLAASGRNGIYECIHEANYQTNDGSPQALFIIIRGEADGSISSVRAKVSLNKIDAQERISPDISKVLYELLETQNWFEVNPVIYSINNFQNVKIEGFGASIVYSRERGNDYNFNLRIGLEVDSGIGKHAMNFKPT
jgi:Family of unknown function (DUF6030)